MSTHDRHAGPPAPWQGEPLPAVAAPAGWDDAHAHGHAGAAKGGGRRLTFGIVLRAVRRHWWQILLAWGVTSAALVVLIHARVKPSFEAIAYIQIDASTGNNPLGQPSMSSDIVSQLETQAQRMMTNDVLGTALLDHEVAKLPRIRNALDAQAELRREVRVQIIPRTRFISVSMSAPTSAEAVTIVNAVSGAYEKSVSDMAADDTQKQTDRLEKALVKFKGEHKSKADDLRKLVQKAQGEAPAPPPEAPDAGPAAIEKARMNIPLEDYRAHLALIGRIEMDAEEAERAVADLKEARRARQDSGKLDAAIDEALKADMAVSSINDQYARAQARVKNAEGLVKGNDPSLTAARKARDELREEGRALIASRRASLRKRMEAQVAAEGDEKLHAAEARARALRGRQAALDKRLKAMKVERIAAAKVNERDNLEIELAKQDLAYIRGVMEQVEHNLQASKLDAEVRTNKVHVIKAIPSYLPTADNAKKLMVAAPVGMLAAVMGLFVMLEVVGGRVADPDDLASRLQLGVIGVVPPLPTSRPSRAALPWGNEEQRSQRRLEEFVQSLDHLRVQIWSGRGAGGANRCILITSACVSEGKSTLAAQLAGRCANAGLTTLLVDADLRRPSQARLLDISAEPGLADVLAGRAEPEDAMVVVGHAGGFHLLPAGAAVRDPSPLLHGQRLGTLMARFREAFDIVIVDAPPVLAVPDALVLGRWTDGAVLAVRHDTSRFPLVERARQKLASVGVPILGAVVNGVRSVDSAYSNYAYTPADGAPDAEGPPA